MNNLYNSVNELKLRVLLLLSETPIYPLSEDMILAIDFISVYGKDFGISDDNLHGDNSYKYSELPSRKEVLDKTIKCLFLEGLINLDTKKGYRYQISDSGLNYISLLDDDYAEEYRNLIMDFFSIYRDYSVNELLKLIQAKSLVNSWEV